jgi:hypothetical protein
MALLIDHLWQSVSCVALAWLLARMLATHPAILHLWLWRIAALKFVVPFTFLYALGAWIGFPVRHSAIPPPAALTRAADLVTPMVAPARNLDASATSPAVEVVLASLLAIAALWLVGSRLRDARASLEAETARVSEDWTAAPAPPGFLKTVVVAACALVLLVTPLVGGALRDRQSRQQSLAIDTRSLRAAPITLRETPFHFGDRAEIVATRNGVVIRKINLQDLVALVYGIGQFEVFGGALPWLESPHYDVEVRGPIHAPATFDPYSLRQPVTNYLNAEYGISIRVTGSCLDPCLDQESFVIERLPWKLMDTLRGTAASSR